MKGSPATAAVFIRYGQNTHTLFARSAATKLSAARAAFAKTPQQ